MKIASIVDNLSLSQNIFWMSKSFNKLSQYNINPFCFYINLGAPGVRFNFPSMNVYYAANFSGVDKPPIICTSLKTLEICMNLKINARKMLYLWDLEWLRLSKSSVVNYKKNAQLLSNKGIELIARSESHADVISNYCNRKVDFITDDWDINFIRGLYERRNS